MGENFKLYFLFLIEKKKQLIFMKLTLYEDNEYGKEYIIVEIELKSLDFIPGYIRVALDHISNNNKLVKIIKRDSNFEEIEYLENSVRSNKKGPAFIDRNGKKYYYIMGLETKDTEKLQNEERGRILKKLLE